MDGALIYRWSGSVPGREAASIALMNEATDVMTHMRDTGKITDFAWFIGAQGGPHFAVVRGPLEALMALGADRTIQALNARGTLVNQDFTWGFYVTGDAAVGQVGLFLELSKNL